MKEIEVENRNGIEVTLRKTPTLLVESKRRSDDIIILEVPDADENDTDLFFEDDMQLHFTNEQALKLAQQLIECAMKNVDKEFMEAYPGVPPPFLIQR